MKKPTLVPELHSKTTGELFLVTHAQAAARLAAGLLKKELKRQEKHQLEGAVYEAGARVALVELYQELMRRGSPSPAGEP